MALALSLVGHHTVKKGRETPRVSFIITARNEAARIRQKIENTLAQDYPSDLLEIIVASDTPEAYSPDTAAFVQNCQSAPVDATAVRKG